MRVAVAVAKKILPAVTSQEVMAVLVVVVMVAATNPVKMLRTGLVVAEEEAVPLKALLQCFSPAVEAVMESSSSAIRRKGSFIPAPRRVAAAVRVDLVPRV